MRSHLEIMHQCWDYTARGHISADEESALALLEGLRTTVSKRVLYRVLDSASALTRLSGDSHSIVLTQLPVPRG